MKTSRLVFALLLYFPISLYAQEVFTSFIHINGEKFQDPVWVEYNNVNQDESVIYIVPALKSLEGSLSPQFLEEIRKKVFEESKVKVKDLKEVGAEVEIDLSTLDIFVKVSYELKKITELRVLKTVADSESIEYLEPDVFSGYMNLRTTNRFSGEKASGATSPYYSQYHALSVDNVFNFKGFVLESQYVFYKDSKQDSHKRQRNYTRLVFDDQKNYVRYTFGDTENSIHGFQEQSFGFGLNILKEFSIEPNYFRSSFKKFKFFLDSPSKVEIFVNGKLLQTQNLPQGPVELSDFPFFTGENSVQVRVTDAFGAMRLVDFSDVNDSRILPIGMSDFNLTYLYPRTDLFYEDVFSESYNFSDGGILSGYYQKGIWEDMVLGVDLQYKDNFLLTGLEGIYGKEEGLFKTNLAYSKANELNGTAARFEFENYLYTNGEVNGLRLVFSGEYRSEGFRSLSFFNKRKYMVQASVGQNFMNNIRASFGVHREWLWDGVGDRTYLSSNFGWSFLKNFDFTSNIRVNINNSEDSVVLLSLNWYSPFNNQQFISVYDPVNKVANAEYLTYPFNGRQNFRTFISGDISDFSKRGTLGLDYFNQRLEGRLAHSSILKENDDFGQVSQLNFGTGLAFTLKSLSLTRPIDNSFALVSMKRKPAGYSIPIGRDSLNKRAEINFWGPAVLNNLAPYYGSSVNLNLNNLPYGYSVLKDNFKFKPTYKSGVSLNVEVKGEVTLYGYAKYNNKNPASYITGNFYKHSSEEENQKRELISQFFTGAGGAFNIEQLKEGEYLLEFIDDEGEAFAPIIMKIEKQIGVVELEEPVILKRVKQ